MAERTRKPQKEIAAAKADSGPRASGMLGTHDDLAASEKALEATLEGLQQLRRGDGVRVTRKHP